MSPGGTILVADEGPVRTLILNRPKSKNALSSEMLCALDKAFEVAHSDDDVAVVVLRGSAQCFSAGADVRELAALDAEGAHRFLVAGRSLLCRIEQTRKPVVAVISGIAAGGGLELALSCTMVLASADARLGLPEATLAFIPGLGGTQRLTRLIGRHRAAHLMLTGSLISAADAWDLGLLSAPPADATVLDEYVRETCIAIANGSRRACSLLLEAISVAASSDLAAGLEVETALASLAVASEDGKEGAAAFLEKRAPRFRTSGVSR